MVVKIASAWCAAGADAERHYRLHACALAQRRQPGSTQPYGLPIFITGLRGCCGESVTGNSALCCTAAAMLLLRRVVSNMCQGVDACPASRILSQHTDSRGTFPNQEVFLEMEPFLLALLTSCDSSLTVRGVLFKPAARMLCSTWCSSLDRIGGVLAVGCATFSMSRALD
ncbi:hypothetical protein BKA80DRAFT_20725 [Phyllosticta citrichinensis]